MTNEEVGAYLRLVLDYYKNGALPNDAVRLRDIARVPVSEWTRIWGQVQPKFQIGADGNWHHEKCDEEITWRNQMMLKKLNQTKKALESRGINVTSDVTLENPGTLHSTLHRKLHGSESESESESDTEKESKAVGAKGSRPATLEAGLTDEVWLTGLKGNRAYEGIDVDREYSKMCVWCQTNRKSPTRRRFVAWLNRIEKPMDAPATASSISAMDKRILYDEYQNCIKRLEAIRQQYSGLQSWTESDKAEHKKLKARRDDLKNKLNIVT